MEEDAITGGGAAGPRPGGRRRPVCPQVWQIVPSLHCSPEWPERWHLLYLPGSLARKMPTGRSAPVCPCRVLERDVGCSVGAMPRTVTNAVFMLSFCPILIEVTPRTVCKSNYNRMNVRTSSLLQKSGMSVKHRRGSASTETAETSDTMST